MDGPLIGDNGLRIVERVAVQATVLSLLAMETQLISQSGRFGLVAIQAFRA